VIVQVRKVEPPGVPGQGAGFEEVCGLEDQSFEARRPGGEC
jgi:hypothetical protein